MTGLFRSELLRAVSRRLTRLLVVVALLGTVAGMVLATVNSRPTSEQDLLRGRQAWEEELERCLNGDYGVDQATLEQSGYSSLEEFCRDNVLLEQFQQVNGLTLSGLDEALQGTVPIVLMLVVVLGASLVGADWSSGSMATLFTWEPRRVRVFVVRALVIALVAFAFAIMVDSVLLLLWRGGVALRGTADTADWLPLALETMGRVGVLAIIWALFAYAAAAITRSTAGGFFVIVGELILVEAVLRGFRPSIARWTLVQNATVFVTDEAAAMVDQNTGEPLGSLSPTAGLATLGVYVVVVLVVAAVATARRDVT